MKPWPILTTIWGYALVVAIVIGLPVAIGFWIGPTIEPLPDTSCQCRCSHD